MIICIGREFGSGGHEIGKRLSDEMEMELSSFVSEKNENIKSVQFVIQTESIHLAEVEATIEEAPENLNFFQKFLKLFGLYD